MNFAAVTKRTFDGHKHPQSCWQMPISKTFAPKPLPDPSHYMICTVWYDGMCVSHYKKELADSVCSWDKTQTSGSADSPSPRQLLPVTSLTSSRHSPGSRLHGMADIVQMATSSKEFGPTSEAILTSVVSARCAAMDIRVVFPLHICERICQELRLTLGRWDARAFECAPI